ncbi:MAG: WcaF family extracellular polysaccharide biosynthesis acetyltransferase [Planctomycetota bacterium]
MNRDSAHRDDERRLDEGSERAQVSPWTKKEQAGRLLWMLVSMTLFRFSPHNAYRFRRALLRLFGAQVGRQCVVRGTARIEIPWNLDIGDYSSVGDFARIYNLGKITIGRRCTVSQYAHLCAGTHDFTRQDMPLLRPAIVLKDDCWVAAEAFVGPGVTLGEGVLLGARSCAFKDLEPWLIYVGNPAKKLKERELH